MQDADYSARMLRTCSRTTIWNVLLEHSFGLFISIIVAIAWNFKIDTSIKFCTVFDLKTK